MQFFFHSELLLFICGSVLRLSVAQPELVILLPQPPGFICTPLGVRVVLFLSVFPL